MTLIPGAESLAGGRVILIHGDCLQVLPQLAAAGVRVDGVASDPPYHLTSIVERFGKQGAAPARDRDGLYARASAGFMGQQWDGGDIAQRVETWAAVRALCKPGAHLAAFAATRTYHRMTCAIEDAGFSVRDMIAWMYGSGFPKSKRLAEGVGTALKPALEPIALCRVPLDGTAVATFAKHGTGGLGIDEARIESGARPWREIGQARDNLIYGKGLAGSRAVADTTIGRWPANIVHDGSDEVLAAFPDALGQQRAVGPEHGRKGSLGIYGEFGRPAVAAPREDSGSAARFFYAAKADALDRFGSRHPTVKPVNLMRWLVRLIVPPGGLVLDPFAGTGTTGVAAIAEGRRAILIEREADWAADIRARFAALDGAGGHSLARRAARRAGAAAAGPLFADPENAA